MKDKSNVMDIVLYPTVIVVGFFIRLLPLRLSLLMARFIGSLVCVFYTKRRSIGYANIKAAFPGKMTPGEIRKTTLLTFQHFTQVLFEIFRFPSIGKKYIEHFVPCEGLQRVEEAIKKGHGAIILTAHFGNWEISGLAGAVNGYPQDVLARQQKFLRLNRLLNKYRERYGRHVIEKGMATRGMIRALKENRIVAILSDQDGGANGVLVNFFNRLASTPQGAAVFALKLKSEVLPNFCVREKGPFYRMIVEKPVTWRITKDSELDAQNVMQAFTDVLQNYISKYPHQWLWLHKRWKTTPSRRVLILSDSKAGHLNQAKAAAKEVRRVVFEKSEKDERVNLLRRNSGFSKEEVDGLIYKEYIIEVRYKSRLHKTLLSLCGLFASSRSQGRLGSLRLCLGKDSYKNLSSVYADIIISCGSSTAAVNRFLCEENRSKGISIMKPGILPVKKFHLCIIPRHDNPAPLPNTVITEGALNLAGGSAVETQNFASLQIGILIGGDNKDFVLTESDMTDVLDGVVSFSEKMNAQISATTSRRTPENIEKLIKDKLAKSANCKLFVIANEKNSPGVVNEILNSSAIAVVSGESISMVSEAASSGSKTIVFKLKTRKQNSRHARFLENLSSKGYIILCEPGDVAKALQQALKDTSPAKKLDDSALVYGAIRKIV